jgi:hypothetical protein
MNTKNLFIYNKLRELAKNCAQGPAEQKEGSLTVARAIYDYLVEVQGLCCNVSEIVRLGSCFNSRHPADVFIDQDNIARLIAVEVCCNEDMSGRASELIKIHEALRPEVRENEIDPRLVSQIEQFCNLVTPRERLCFVREIVSKVSIELSIIKGVVEGDHQLGRRVIVCTHKHLSNLVRLKTHPRYNDLHNISLVLNAYNYDSDFKTLHHTLLRGLKDDERPLAEFRWDWESDEEKLQTLQGVADRITELSGLPPIPLVFRKMHGALGLCRKDETGQSYIDVDPLVLTGTLLEAVKTIGHEVAHYMEDVFTPNDYINRCGSLNTRLAEFLCTVFQANNAAYVGITENEPIHFLQASEQHAEWFSSKIALWFKGRPEYKAHRSIQKDKAKRPRRVKAGVCDKGTPSTDPS